MTFTGSKGQAGVFQRIIGQMRPHRLYVEPFAGRARVCFEKLPARHTILIDVDKKRIAKIDAAVRSARNGAAAGGSAGNGVSGHVDTIVGDAFEWLPKIAKLVNYHPLKPAVVYVDPPYLLSTRNHRRYYEHELTEDQHARLLTLLQALPCDVLLSGYPSKLYSSRLKKWRCITYRTRTRGSTVTECLWCNFPEPTELHDWRYAGQNFRQRVSFGRQATRWLARLNRMPARKRGYLLDAISQRYFQRVAPSEFSRELSARQPVVADEMH